MVVTVRIVGVDGEPVMHQQTIQLSTQGVTWTAGDVLVLQPGRYRVEVQAPPGLPDPPQPPSAADIVDEMARRLAGVDRDRWGENE